MSAIIDAEPIATEIGSGRARKLCRCSFCGYTAVCLPDDDFFSTSGPSNPTGGPLACERCMLAGKVATTATTRAT